MSANAFTALGKWGPKVIGEEQYQYEQEVKRIGAHKWGPMVTGVELTPPVNKFGSKTTPAKPTLTYNEMRAKASALGLTFEGTPSKEVLAAALEGKI